MPAMPPEFMAQMEAYTIAGRPGKMHERLTRAAGTWDGINRMWMMPGMDPFEAPCVAVMTPVMDGRYIRVEVDGEMGGMGRYNGFGLYGYDNTEGQFQSVWIDNMSTGMMVGTGELSDDGTTLTWNMRYTCPARKHPITLREVERHIDENTMVMEMFGPDHEGNEYKMMEIRYKRRKGPAGGDDKPADARPAGEMKAN